MGTVTAGRVFGLGLGGDLTFPGKPTIPGGISYGDFEALELELGSGGDNITLESTHAGTTRIAGNNGADTFLVKTIAGHTFVQGGAGDDRILVGNAALLDDIRAILVLDGGAGVDYVLADDSAETDDSLGTLTQTTLTGLDMTATSASTVSTR